MADDEYIEVMLPRVLARAWWWSWLCNLGVPLLRNNPPGSPRWWAGRALMATGANLCVLHVKALGLADRGRLYIVASTWATAEDLRPMKPRLYGLAHAPRNPPSWRTLVESLCEPTHADLARVLGVSVRTIERYNATDKAPRAVRLALFWITPYGRNAIHTQAHNDATLLASYVDSLERHVQDLEALIEHMRRIGHFGAANDPTSLASRPDATTLPRRLNPLPR